MGPPSPVREITRRLEALYGETEWVPNRRPVDTLVACILSQHTSDVNSERAFERLRARFPTWEEVVEAPIAEVADAIRCGGLADSKTPKIQAALRQISEMEGEIDLSRLDEMTDDAARAYLLNLPAVGPKTAAIVLCFALGRPVLPVDTHVFRVASRLGLVDANVGEARAHDALQALVPDDLVYRFHIALIRHGRTICRARLPRCERCPLAGMCAYATERRIGL